MSYVDAPGLLERFDEIELLASADRDGDQVVDSSLVEQAINDAGAEIDAYLRARYTLPLPDPVDPLIGRLAADIARYLLQDDNPLDEAVERYRRAVELRHVSGLSYPELAEALDRPLGTVKSDVHRGVRLLREALMDEEMNSSHEVAG